jgi:hypothetical protein
MTSNAKTEFPKEWLERVPAEVFACLIPGELRIIVFPGYGQANGGAPWDVAAELIPPHLRLPNTQLWLRLDNEMNILAVWQRQEG